MRLKSCSPRPLTWQLAEEESDRFLCYQLRSREYGRRYSNIAKDKYSDQIDANQLSNGTPQSFTIFVKEEGKEEISGTIRGTIIHQQGNSEILNSETGMLMCMRNSNGRDTLQVIADTPNLNVTVIAEIGKLAIAHDASDKLSVFKELIIGVITVGKTQYNVDLWLGVMSPRIVRFFKRSGLPMQLVLGCCLNRENPNTLKYIVKYYEYFLPKLASSEYRYLIENEISEASDLKKLVSNCDDGVNLYSLTIKQFRNVQFKI